MSALPTQDAKNGMKVRTSPYFKLKRQQGRNFMAIDLVKGFGFLPETIIIERDTSRSNVIRVSAILNADEIKKEDKKVAESRKFIENMQKQIKEKEKGGTNDSTKQEPAPKKEGQTFEIR